MSPAYRCVLFDLDGTLINTYRLYLEAFRCTLKPHYKRRLTDEEILALDPHAEQRLLLATIDEFDFNAYFDAFLTYYAQLHETLFDGPYEGVLPMLRSLREAGYLLGLVTGKSREAWRITSTRMEAEAFDDLFDVVLTDDDVQAPKPSPEGLLLALDALELQPAQALVIGDSQRDCDAAEAAGLAFGAALWSRTRGRQAFSDPVIQGEVSHRFQAPADVVAALLHERSLP
jgi:HAD superfamily hydrolase (TIGR01509 family)